MAVGAASEAVWQAPASLEDAEHLQAEIMSEIQMIQAQLSDRDRTDEHGRRVTGIAYFQWRKKATFALAKKLDEYRRLKQWIKERRRQTNAVESISLKQKPRNVVELVAALTKALKDGIEWSEMTADEQAIVTLAEKWIRTKGLDAIRQAEAAR